MFRNSAQCFLVEIGQAHIFSFLCRFWEIVFRKGSVKCIHVKLFTISPWNLLNIFRMSTYLLHSDFYSWPGNISRQLYLGKSLFLENYLDSHVVVL